VKHENQGDERVNRKAESEISQAKRLQRKAKRVHGTAKHVHGMAKHAKESAESVHGNSERLHGCAKRPQKWSEHKNKSAEQEKYFSENENKLSERLRELTESAKDYAKRVYGWPENGHKRPFDTKETPANSLFPTSSKVTGGRELASQLDLRIPVVFPGKTPATSPRTRPTGRLRSLRNDGSAAGVGADSAGCPRRHPWRTGSRR
jgi:hypothetical protein